MSGWIVLAVWATGFVVAARKISLALINDDEKDGRPSDGTDRAASRVMGCLLGALWPALLIGAVITGKLPRTGAQLRAEAEQRKQRIAELEAENERLRHQQESVS